MRNIIITLSIILLAASCGSRKKSTSTIKDLEHKIDSLTFVSTQRLTDTVREVKKEYVYDVKESFIEIEVGCDSLGNVTETRYNASTGLAEASVIIKDNKLTMAFKIDSVKSSFESVYKAKYKQDSILLDKKLIEKHDRSEVNTKVIKKRFPWWLLMLCFGAGVGLSYFLKVKNLFPFI